MANLLFWVIWAYLATHTKNDSINLKKPLFFICKQKINFILHLSLEILHGYCKLFIFGASGMPGYAHPKWYYQLVESFRIYLLDFSYLFIFFYFSYSFIHHVLLEILQRYAKFLFWALWACLATDMQNDSINLKKILMFIRSFYSILP